MTVPRASVRQATNGSDYNNLARQRGLGAAPRRLAAPLDKVRKNYIIREIYFYPKGNCETSPFVRQSRRRIAPDRTPEKSKESFT